VTDAETAQRCIDAGAEFLVGPGFDLETVKLANHVGILIMSGALTPTEVITAWKSGSDFVKIFPCGTVGGAKYIQALKAPLPHIPMVPTGGVNLATAPDFIRAGAAALGVGGDLVSTTALNYGNTGEIVDAARRFVSIMRETRAQMQR
jgi:2-dehydro-3-deoxyphosphogluconate aldolase/(4S)-4-hydroxy-2-oxoglutarate aldolase